MPDTPDALGVSQRTQIVAELLADLQGQAFRLKLMQTANGHEDDEPMPGGEDEITYGAKLANLEAAQERVVEAYAPYMEAVRVALNGGGPDEQ